MATAAKNHKKSTKTLANRTSRFHGEVMTPSGPVEQTGKTLEACKKALEGLVTGPCVYRPDPVNDSVTFIYNTQWATQIYQGEARAALPIGWIAKIDVPEFIAEMEVANAIDQLEGPVPTSDDELDELFGDYDGPEGDPEDVLA